MNTRDEYDGVIDKPEIKDLFIEHGLHKYVDRYLGKNGKWIYKYAQAGSDVSTTGAINKIKTAMPNLPKPVSTVTSTVKKNTTPSTATKSAISSQAKERIKSMLPNLLKKSESKNNNQSDSSKDSKKQTDEEYLTAKKKAYESYLEAKKKAYESYLESKKNRRIKKEKKNKK